MIKKETSRIITGFRLYSVATDASAVAGQIKSGYKEIIWYIRIFGKKIILRKIRKDHF